jgi:uncharacterized membrane protein YfcA
VEWLQANYELTAFDTILVAATAFVAGLMRGFSGFGAALTIAPVLAVAVGPRAAIPAILFLMLATSAQLAPRAIRDVNWPTVVPLSVGGAIGILIGAWMLIVVDQELVKKSISVTVIFFAIVMLTGWRYRGSVGPLMSGFAGWLGGLISGVAAAGGPAVIIFLLAGPESAARNRAAIILYFIFTQAVALVVYWFGGLITLKTFWVALPMLPTIMLGTWIGEKMFGKASDELYRRIALIFLLAIGLSTFFA